MISGLAQYYNEFNENKRQYCSISVIPPNYSGFQVTLILSDADIMQGGLIIDRKSMSSETIEIGSAVAAEMTLRLRGAGNPNINIFDWYGAKVIINIGVEYGGAIVYSPIGEFYVDEASSKNDLWTIHGFDALVKFDKKITEEELAALEGMTLYNAIGRACEVCGVTRDTSTTSTAVIVNHDQVIPKIDARYDITWRNLLQWIGELNSCCVFVTESGALAMNWYGWDDTTGKADITLSRRYSSHTSYDDIRITGLVITDSLKNEYKVGSEGYQIKIENNPLVNPTTLTSRAINRIYTKLTSVNGYYVPCEASTFPFPYLLPMDKIRVFDKYGTAFTTILTNNRYVFNGASDIRSEGKSTPNMSRTQGSALTKQQAVILDDFQKELADYINKREEALRELSQLMANSIGLNLYRDNNGIYYFYDAVKRDDDGAGVRGIENANIIYTFRSGGLAWAQGDSTASAWEKAQNNDWNFGITKEGNAYLNQINATGISVVKVDSDFETQITPEEWELLHKGNTLISASGSTGEGILTLDKVQMTDNGYIRMGKARMYGTNIGMDIVIEG